MNLTPNKTRVIVSAIEPKTESDGGIIIPDSAKEKSSFGIVVAVGKEVEQFKVEDLVVFSHYSGLEFTLDRKKYLSFKAEDIHCVVEGE